MKSRHRLLWQIFPLITDLISFALSMIISYHLRFKFITFESLPPLSEYIAAIIPFIILMSGAFYASSAYRERTCFSASEAWSIVRGASIGALFILAASSMYRGFSYSRLVIAGAVLISAFLSFIFRLSIRSSQTQSLLKGKGLIHTAVIGDPESCMDMISRLGRSELTGREIAGFITHDGEESLGSTDNIEEAVNAYNLDEILITLPYVSRTEVYNIVEKLEPLPVKISIIPDIYELLTENSAFDMVGGMPFLEVRVIRLQGWNALIKRIFDISLSFIGLIILSPFLLFIAFLVKLSSSGPVFYKQERVGLDGKSFIMFKFRSMKMDAEDTTGPVWAVENDPRRTAFGAFLRKFSIDEFPQLWNVLRGDMSLVGPRPERPHFVDQFQKAIPRYMVRHRVLTGITGWAQVNGLRGDTSIEDRTRYDLWYVENWSLSLDIRILLRTLLEVLTHKTAY